MCKFGDIEKVTDQLAHHLTGIILTIIGERQFLIMVKKFLAHIPFHVCTHHMSLIRDVVFAETLNDIHEKKTSGDERECVKDVRFVLGK